eukprot:TRINITY_DN17297_c0_g1_i1.p1 TRINITY_DN17297_c0_g1~~TRINITY_DN17297_c0_g1_i1.p1  ORF type:complete len:135 (+),score=27.32 TRINITY_DN17297_c0_g1_i1:73-477(+)
MLRSLVGSEMCIRDSRSASSPSKSVRFRNEQQKHNNGGDHNSGASTTSEDPLPHHPAISPIRNPSHQQQDFPSVVGGGGGGRHVSPNSRSRRHSNHGTESATSPSRHQAASPRKVVSPRGASGNKHDYLSLIHI